ncbi:MAG: homoserine dehydrogenase [Candidatus Syntropharchaeales archaeon]
MKEIRVSIIGFGTVGKGVFEVISRKKEILRKRGLDIIVTAIVDLWGALIDESGVDPKKIENAVEMKGIDVIREVEHDVVIETTPTNIVDGEPGLTHMIEALKNGKHVVTSNKGPLALKYRKLMEIAEKNEREIKFEATVGGAMPLINLARKTLAGNEILSVRGILNGTCNYILTRMMQEGLPYEHVLSEAQEIGIAETDPKYDVEGIDTAEKLVILANALVGMDATYKDVNVVGITEITPEALKLASDANFFIKLIGEVDKEEKTLEVAPKLVPKNHPFAVGGTLNVASIETDLAGEITVIGKGAGAIEAASAILSDLIDLGNRL